MAQLSQDKLGRAELCHQLFNKKDYPAPLHRRQGAVDNEATKVMLEIRALLEAVILDDDCDVWLDYLHDPASETFVFACLKVLDRVPIRLLNAVLELSLQRRNWYRLEYLVKQCCRLLGEAGVSEFLVNQVQSEKGLRLLGSLYALHFVRSRIHFVENIFFDPNGPEFFKTGVKYQWNGKQYVLDMLDAGDGRHTRMSPRELYMREKLECKIFYRRHKELLVLLLNCEDRSIAERICGLLPAKEGRYHIRLRPLFKQAAAYCKQHHLSLQNSIIAYLKADIAEGRRRAGKE